MQPFYWVGCFLLISLCRRLHRLQQAGRLRSKQYATTLRRVKKKGGDRSPPFPYSKTVLPGAPTKSPIGSGQAGQAAGRGKGLEGQPQAQRHDARCWCPQRGSRGVLRQALRCAKRAIAQIAVNTIEAGVVEEVLGCGSEFELHHLCQLEGLAQGHVHLHELRPMKNISTESAEAFVQGTGARIRGVAKERVCHETCDVSIRIQNWRKAIVVQVTIRKAA